MSPVLDEWGALRAFFTVALIGTPLVMAFAWYATMCIGTAWTGTGCTDE